MSNDERVTHEMSEQDAGTSELRIGRQCLLDALRLIPPAIRDREIEEAKKEIAADEESDALDQAIEILIEGWSLDDKRKFVGGHWRFIGSAKAE
jgi:hypothetical protein